MSHWPCVSGWKVLTTGSSAAVVEMSWKLMLHTAVIYASNFTFTFYVSLMLFRHVTPSEYLKTIVPLPLRNQYSSFSVSTHLSSVCYSFSWFLYVPPVSSFNNLLSRVHFSHLIIDHYTLIHSIVMIKPVNVAVAMILMIGIIKQLIIKWIYTTVVFIDCYFKVRLELVI